MERPSSWQSQELTVAAMSAGHGLVVVDAEGTVVWTNPAVERLLGWPSSELSGRDIGEALGTRTQERRTPFAGPAGEWPPFGTLRVNTARTDGLERDLEFEVILGADSDGPPDGAVVVLRDVTEDDPKGLERFRPRARLGSVPGATPQAILDTEGRFTDVNAAACNLLGRPRQALLGRAAQEFLDPLDPTRGAKIPAVLTGELGVPRRHEVVARDGSGRRLPLLVEVSALLGQGDRLEGFACIATDLSNMRDVERRLAGQERFYRALNRSASDLSIVTDADGNLVYVSPSVNDLLGYSPQEVVAHSGFDFVHPEDQTAAHQLVESALRDPNRPARALLRVRHASGQWRWVEESVTNLIADPDVGGLVANLRDVTGEIEGQIALQRSEARYRAIVEGAHEGILVLDKNSDVMFANEHMAEIVGYSLTEVYENGLWCAFDPDDAGRLHQRVLARAETGPEQYELPFRTPNGDLRTLKVSASPLHYDEGMGVLAMVTDVTAERRAEAELRRRALRDTLTGLPNRALLADRLDSAAARQTRFDTRGLAMLFIDLDDMKSVNDRAGHACGDALLIEVGQRLTHAVREVDTVTRLGGDEFAILCEDLDAEDATVVAQRVERAFVPPFVIDNQSFEISASIGVALSPPHALTDLLHLADKAMYEAKERSRGSFLVFDSTMARNAKRKTRLSGEIVAALGGDELVVHYQPIVGLRDGRVQGVEALVRWQHPTLGMLQPAEVLDVARDTGMESRLDAAVLAIACRDMGQLLRDGVLDADSYVSVNLSAASAMSAPLGVSVPASLERAGLSPRHLVLEVTETSVMADVEQTAARLRALTSLGVRIALDDFGTGYSSLAYLHRLPLDILKIDRSFVSGLTAEDGSTAIIRSVLTLAEALGLHVVAEGVETPEQAATLRSMGCYSAQGYLWCPPVPLSELPSGTVSVSD